MPRALPALLALALSLPACGDAAAQVRRCELPDGQTVYTDRPCDAIGATEHRAPPSGQARLRTYRAACPRTLRDLYFEVTASFESHDVNRLAGVYHWTGMSTRQGYDLMRRLQALVDRPFVDIQPIWPGAGDEPYAPRRAPVGFRVEQTSANGRTPVRAVLGLRRHLDCWWVTLGAPARAPAVVPAAPSEDAVDTPGQGVDRPSLAPAQRPAD